MCQVSIKIPDAVMYDTRMNQNDVEKFIRRLVAVEYYKSKGISIGYCAEIAGMSEADFIKYLGKKKISIFQFEDEVEFMNEAQNA